MMKTIKFKAYFEVHIAANVSRSEELEIQVEENATYEEIEAEKEHATTEWASQFIGIGYD